MAQLRDFGGIDFGPSPSQTRDESSRGEALEEHAFWEVSVVPFKVIGNADSEQKRNGLIEAWVKTMSHQLSNVMVTGTILSGVIVGSFTWTIFDQMLPTAMTIIRILWYSSLILSMTAVGVALHQSVFLARMVNVPEFHAVMVDLLCFETPMGQMKPRQEQAFIWLLAIGLLEWSLGLWFGGFVVFIWKLTKIGQQDQTFSDRMVAGFVGLAVFMSAFIYFFSIIGLWRGALKSRHTMEIK
ncbi:unnamed protein product [Clonostachys chloroleuca]|uniref:Uncharacterized protein n=1 Tax=Clonostachys chloroleuca TaxID=1926264 RepID=A0AA35Q1I8_9HYPO|nr:unnamed protein product [Clonostachys chloroleuca]